MKKLFLLALVFALVMMTVACGGGDSGGNDSSVPDDEGAAERTLTFTYVMQTANDEFCLAQRDGVEAMGREIGVNINVVAPVGSSAGEKTAEQVAFLETCISSGIDGILIMPADPAGIASTVKKVVDAGIPIICLDQGIPEDVRDSVGLGPVPVIGTDNVEGGRLVGRFIMDNFDEGVKFAVLQGIQGATTNTDRQAGMYEVIGDPDTGDSYVNRVFNQNADWETEKGFNLMENCITANPDIELVFCLCDTIAVGAARAIENAGKLDQISIISYDGNGFALEMVREGKIMVDATQYPDQMGGIGVQHLYDFLINGVSIPLSTATDIAMVTQDIVDNFL